VAEDGLSAMPVRAKWGSFEDLYGAVEDAARPRASAVTGPGRD
jgi:hypothetical protein